MTDGHKSLVKNKTQNKEPLALLEKKALDKSCTAHVIILESLIIHNHI